MTALRTSALGFPAGHQRTADQLILFLPGLSGNQRQWDAVIPLIDAHAVEIAFGAPILENPNIGLDTPTIENLAGLMCREIRELRYERVVVVTHSVGAFVGCEIAAALPDLVSRLVIINGALTTVAGLLDRPLRTLASHPSRHWETLRLFVLVGAPVPRRLKKLIATNERLSRALLGGLVSRETTHSQERRESLIEEAGTPKTLKALVVNRHHWLVFQQNAFRVRCPVDLVVGELDPMGSAADAEEFQAFLPAARIHLLPDAGHAAPLEVPDKIAALINAGIRGGQ